MESSCPNNELLCHEDGSGDPELLQWCDIVELKVLSSRRYSSALKGDDDLERKRKHLLSLID